MKGYLLLLVAAVGCATGGNRKPEAPTLEVGFASVDITPPLGYPMGSYRFVTKVRTATEVRDPLSAKAIVLAQGSTRAALVVVDVGGLLGPITAKARAEIFKKTGIPVAHIAITATHTHTGPALESGLHPFDYPAALVDNLVSVVQRALHNRRPAELGAAMVEQRPVVSFQRRHLFKDGQVRMIGPTNRHLPEYQPTHLVRTTGPIDPAVGILAMREPGASSLLGVLTVFALHPNTVGDTRHGETVWSGDFPHVINRELERALGAKEKALFATGTCGDINYVDPHVPSTRTTEEIGTMLSKTVLTTLPEIRSRQNGALAVRTTRFDAPRRRFSPEQVAAARNDLERYEELSFLRRTEAITMVEVAAASGPTFPVEIQAFRLTPEIALVALPGELFVEHGLAIKKASPFRTTLVLALANDKAPGYVPTRKAFAEGGYEVLHAKLEVGSGERMVAESLSLLHRLAAAPR